MAKMTKANRAATQSVRAKARKALAVEGVKLPKAVVKSLESVITWANKQLAAKVTKLTPKATGPVQDQEDAVAEQAAAQA